MGHWLVRSGISGKKKEAETYCKLDPEESKYAGCFGKVGLVRKETCCSQDIPDTATDPFTRPQILAYCRHRQPFQHQREPMEEEQRHILKHISSFVSPCALNLKGYSC